MDWNLSFVRYLKYSNIKDRNTYLKWYNFIEKSQWWSREEIEKYQWMKLMELLQHAYTTVPYYRGLFEKMGAEPGDIKTWDDFKRIPYLTKEIVRDRTDDLISNQIKHKSKLKTHSTGGSTGQPLRLYVIPEMDAIGRAFMSHQWGRVGYQEQNSRIILRGEPLKNKQLFEKIRFSNNWFVSSYHLTKDHMKQYVDFLNSIKPDFLHVYPSCLYIFTQLFLQSKHKLNFVPKAILCGSEAVYEYQRELFEDTYKTRVYSWLGLAEGTILAGECEHSSSLHAWPQFSYNELIDTDGMKITEKGCSGAIIGTSLVNYVTPFVRYRSGDLATYGGSKCDLCGRQHLILDQVDGREQNILILADGRRVPLTSIPFRVKYDAFKRIKMMQMVQNVAGELLIRLSTTDDFSSEDETEIRTKMLSAANNQLLLSFEYTDNFTRSKTGKNIYFIQNVK